MNVFLCHTGQTPCVLNGTVGDFTAFQSGAGGRGAGLCLREAANEPSLQKQIFKAILF